MSEIIKQGFPIPASSAAVAEYLKDANEQLRREVVANILRDRAAGLHTDESAYDLLKLAFPGESP